MRSSGELIVCLLGRLKAHSNRNDGPENKRLYFFKIKEPIMKYTEIFIKVLKYKQTIAYVLKYLK